MLLFESKVSIDQFKLNASFYSTFHSKCFTRIAIHKTFVNIRFKRIVNRWKRKIVDSYSCLNTKGFILLTHTTSDKWKKEFLLLLSSLSLSLSHQWKQKSAKWMLRHIYCKTFSFIELLLVLVRKMRFSWIELSANLLMAKTISLYADRNMNGSQQFVFNIY